MARYLMDACIFYKKRDCPNEKVSNARRGGPVEPGKPFPMFPTGLEQEKLDEVCESCPSGRFEMRDETCPVCREDFRFKRDQPEREDLGPESRPEWYYFFRCHEGHRLYNKKDILG
jgi:hypothetical protein